MKGDSSTCVCNEEVELVITFANNEHKVWCKCITYSQNLNRYFYHVTAGFTVSGRVVHWLGVITFTVFTFYIETSKSYYKY